MNRWGFTFSLLFCLMAVFGTGWATDLPDEEVTLIRTPATKILIVAVNPRIINEGLVDTNVIRQATSGLSVVGVGEQVFVAAAPGGLEPVAYEWSLAAPTGSAVTSLSDGKEAGQLFVPDVEGDYEVTLKITHTEGDTTLTQTITAAKYVGVDKCAQCHASMPSPGFVDGWKETGHAKMLRRGLSGTLSGHYNGGCVKCHSLSSNTANTATPVADNDGFEDVAAAVGWAFPEHLDEGTWAKSDDPQTPDAGNFAGGAWKLDLTGSAWDKLPDELKALAGIQCESCHGPGSAHAASGNKAKIGKSLDAGVCARCHDDGHYHVRPHEWESSGHAKVWSRNSASCAVCHLGSGFLESVKLGSKSIPSGSFELGVTQTCATCHNPHSVATEHQVRFTGAATLNAMVPGQGSDPVEFVAEMGNAAMCANCHRMRSEAGRNEIGTSIHHSHQTEMIQGIGGYHYPDKTYQSGSHKEMANVCVTCHMSSPPEGGAGHLGSHSWGMHYDNGTPDDMSDDIYNTTGCANCHGPLANFDVNGAQTEIEELLHALADLLPHVDGEPGEVATYYSEGSHGTAAREMTDAEMQAGWNQRFVHDDGSEGVHNFRYARKLLVDALAAMKPESQMVAGDFSGDGKINFDDLFMFVANFGRSEASEGWDAKFDLSGNGVVGFADWLMLLDAFGKASGAGKPAPIVENGRNTLATFSLVGSDRQSIDQDHIGVSLRADRLTEMRGYGVVITYDTGVLEFVRAVRADEGLVASGEDAPALAVVEESPGRIVVSDAIAGEGAVAGSGLLTDLIFRRLGMADASSVQIDFAQVSDLGYGMNDPLNTVEAAEAPALAYALEQNFPNPFNPATSIHYSMADAGDVKVVVYNTLGQAVRTLVDHYKLAGNYTVKWDGRDSAGSEVASGIYLYRMEAGNFSAAHRMVLMK